MFTLTLSLVLISVLSLGVIIIGTRRNLAWAKITLRRRSR